MNELPAVKHLDPVLGVDIHFIITPPGPVVPIPHPHVGIVFDPFDYLPVVGATVMVNGLPRVQASAATPERARADDAQPPSGQRSRPDRMELQARL